MRILFTNFNEARELLDSKDFFVSRLLYPVAGQVTHVTKKIAEPLAPFDERLFYVMMVRTVARSLGYEPNHHLEPQKLVTPFNLPSFEELRWKGSYFVEIGLAELFCGAMREIAAPDAERFDMGFAIEVASRAIDSKERLDIIASVRGMETRYEDPWSQ